MATGSRPFIAPIKGLDTVPFVTSDLLTSHESMELKERPESLTIVGGGYIAAELVCPANNFTILAGLFAAFA